MVNKNILKVSADAVFSTIEKAGNWLKGLKQQVKDKAVPEGSIPINVDDRSERSKFLRYAISLLDPQDYPAGQRGKILMFKRMLESEVRGYNLQWIASSAGCSLDSAEKWKREAMECVKDAINRRQKQGIPIVGQN